MSDLLTLAAPEVRTYPPTFELREMDGTDSGSMLSGLAVPYSEEFEDVGWYFERFRKGVFAKSIREAAKGLPLLMFHDSAKMPVGVSVEWREANDGLHGVWKIDTADPVAVEAARKARDGFLTGLSVGFAPIENGTTREYDDHDALYVTRTEARLLEVSLTPTPAYAGAQVQYVRSRETDTRKRTVQRARLAEWQQYREAIRRG